MIMVKPVNPILLLLLSSFITATFAARHKLVVGSFSTELIHTLEYDDVDNTLTKLTHSFVGAASSWLTLNHDKTKLYGTDWNAKEPTFVSYDVSNPHDIKVEKRIVAGTLCSNTRNVFALADQQAPYTVYGNYYYGDAKCSTVFSVDGNGTLKEVIQDYAYLPGSAVHGTAITLDGRFLVSADTKGNLVWTHAIDRDTGLLSSVSAIQGPSDGSGPRHLVTKVSSGNGQPLVYVVLEEASAVAQYAIRDDGTLYPVGDKISYPLLPAGLDPAGYWADEVALSSPGNRYLWATNRARNDSLKGYISAFRLGRDSGLIEEQLFLRETSTSGGFANSIAASPFDDEIAALTDNSTGLVQIWHVDKGVLAHLEIPDNQSCCANVVWLD
ncbi:carboxy-cis,cis-muconate cyclase [Poronia punctata]|nr:carboxy-cis,cis-muconate cyclase [Poronia punctata]